MFSWYYLVHFRSVSGVLILTEVGALWPAAGRLNSFTGSKPGPHSNLWKVFNIPSHFTPLNVGDLCKSFSFVLILFSSKGQNSVHFATIFSSLSWFLLPFITPLSRSDCHTICSLFPSFPGMNCLWCLLPSPWGCPLPPPLLHGPAGLRTFPEFITFRSETLHISNICLITPVFLINLSGPPS